MTQKIPLRYDIWLVCVWSHRSVETEPQNDILYQSWYFIANPECGVQVYKSEYKSGYWLEFKRQENWGLDISFE